VEKPEKIAERYGIRRSSWEELLGTLTAPAPQSGTDDIDEAEVTRIWIEARLLGLVN
jgi:hypothetical protein